MAKALFITGTATDVGKTFVTALIVKKLQENGQKAAYYKAAMSGNKRRKDHTLIPGDAQYVKDISGITQPLEEMCPYIYENAVSPHLASRIEGNPVCMDVVRQNFHKICNQYDYITVEGSGGILCPIRYDKTKLFLTDIIEELSLSSLLIADAGLGTINSVILTIEYMRAHSLPIEGIIFNHFHPGNIIEEDNRKMCESLTGLKVLACVQDHDTDLSMDAKLLASLYHKTSKEAQDDLVSLPADEDHAHTL